MSSAKQIPYESEIARKMVHMASLLIPIIYLNVAHETGVFILAWLAATSVIIDVLMHYHAPTRRVLVSLVGPIMRTHELSSEKFLLTGASWVLISALITIAVFPKSIAVTAFTILIVSDTCAALVGRRVPGPKFLDKTLVGTSTFIVSAWIVVGVYGAIYGMPWTFYVAGLIGSVMGGIAEAASTRLRLDDNVSVPLSIALTMSLLGWLFVSMGLPDFFGAIP